MFGFPSNETIKKVEPYLPTLLFATLTLGCAGWNRVAGVSRYIPIIPGLSEGGLLLALGSASGTSLLHHIDGAEGVNKTVLVFFGTICGTLVGVKVLKKWVSLSYMAIGGCAVTATVGSGILEVMFSTGSHYHLNDDEGTPVGDTPVGGEENAVEADGVPVLVNSEDEGEVPEIENVGSVAEAQDGSHTFSLENAWQRNGTFAIPPNFVLPSFADLSSSSTLRPWWSTGGEWKSYSYQKTIDVSEFINDIDPQLLSKF
ncbi:MAG: hypothetical protein K1060chlam2_01559, partial [Chlamydiae bacterium]|nr:hypothetical protein [Chlamydiota bacterium]